MAFVTVLLVSRASLGGVGCVGEPTGGASLCSSPCVSITPAERVAEWRVLVFVFFLSFSPFYYLSKLSPRCGVWASRCSDFSCCGPQASGVVVCGLSFSTARGIFPDEGWKLCPLHWQADSQPLEHQGSPQSQGFESHLGRVMRLIVCVVLGGPRSLTQAHFRSTVRTCAWASSYRQAPWAPVRCWPDKQSLLSWSSHSREGKGQEGAG